MKIATLVLGLLAGLAFSGAQAATTDTVQYGSAGTSSPTYFVDVDANKYSSPYYRGTDLDWGWTHNAIAGTFTSASLNISAFDVDAGPTSYYELDNIYAKDNGVWTLIGSLSGNNDQWAFSTFALGANFYDDIATGLQVKIDIDANRSGWLVTLAKSSLSVDGGTLPPPIPSIPEPETYAMLLAGLGLIGGIARRRKAKQN